MWRKILFFLFTSIALTKKISHAEKILFYARVVVYLQ